MNNSKKFKLIIDVLFVLLCVGFAGLFLNLPTGLRSIGQDNKDVFDWSFFSWSLFILSLISYILLIIGIKNLKDAAKIMVSKNHFDISLPKKLRTTGNFLIISSISSYLVFILIFIEEFIIENRLNVYFDNNIFSQIMITIMGLFFVIQSNVLKLASNFKNENDLTI
ncbi:DUF2975 domain-containing protein [Maribacter sp. Asnod2-G09]|uniref:DUF2975 domain-containing protein n=1 Tax=Maribacter sp. Asnod2-G09 TaxID=3160577 RepID=UPI00386C1B68